MTPPMPPRAPTWLLNQLLAVKDKDAVIGDLIEEQALRQSQAGRGEALWFWGQVARSAVPLLTAAARRERWHAMIGAALVAYIVATTIESVLTIAVRQVFVHDTFAEVFAVLIVGVAAMAVGGYVAARMRRGAAAVLAMLTALLVIVLMVTETGGVPVWYAIGFLVLGPLASLTGGALLRRA